MRVVGIDTGGTFTDLVDIDVAGKIIVQKVPSTPNDYAQGVVDAVALVDGKTTSDLQSVTVGTTIATNTLLTRAGAKVGMFMTMGHGDTLEVMRVFGRVAGLSSRESQHYALTDKPTPIVPRWLVKEITERIDCRGDIIVPINEQAVTKGIRELIDDGIELLAVSFLWSFLNPVHEQRVRDICNEQYPDLNVVLSSDVAPKLGEYERSVTTAIDAYVTPALARYLDRINEELGIKNVATPLLVMHSSGGVGTQEYTRNHAVATLFSGPAGGVVGARHVGDCLGHSNIICTDMGGTTFDVGLVFDSQALLRASTTIDQHVLFLPSIDIVSVGAGGGSVVEVQDGQIKIGPESAGADPGPVCYGRGGTRPTLTDINVLLGYIDPNRFLGGEMALDFDRAKAVISENLADPLGMDLEGVASSVFSIANARMSDLIRKVTVERGLDPRDFVVYAYGGLGPLHAPFYGSELGVKSIVVPLGQISSVFSAYGIAVSDLLHVYEQSKLLDAPFEINAINATFANLEKSANEQLDRDRIPSKDREFHRYVDMRYEGQFSEIVVPVQQDALSLSESSYFSTEFERHYELAYGPGSLWKEGIIEIATFRVEAIGRRTSPTSSYSQKGKESTSRSVGVREVYWPSEQSYVLTTIIDGNHIVPDCPVKGPAVLDLGTTTVLVPPTWSCVADATETLVITPGN